jgi:glutathione S-transferase
VDGVLVDHSQKVTYEEKPVDYAAMKADKEGYPFGQAPRLIDGQLNLVQSYAITRHLARKYNLYGGSLEEQAKVGIIICEIRSAPHYIMLSHNQTLFQRPLRTFVHHIPLLYTLKVILMLRSRSLQARARQYSLLWRGCLPRTTVAVGTLSETTSLMLIW